MPKRTDIKSILILGAGPIIIGQACEFDYSGAQACKALREEGFRVILVNSNPATIMTDPSMADATYIEPVEWKTVARIIEDERPDALLPTMGGQTALNCALDLAKHGILDKFSVEMIGANTDAIDKAEDRERFDKAMKKLTEDDYSRLLNPLNEKALNVLRRLEALGVKEGDPIFDSKGTNGNLNEDENIRDRIEEEILGYRKSAADLEEKNISKNDDINEENNSTVESMFCSTCGNLCKIVDKFCSSCGSEVK